MKKISEETNGLVLAIILFFLIMFLIIILFVPIKKAEAETLKGYDVLGLAMYCDTYLKAPKLPALSTLMNTFGNPLNCIEKQEKKEPLKLIQIDLIDATCWRNNKCPPGAAKPTDLKIIEARAKEVYITAKKYPTTEWQISPALEHDVKDNNTVKKMMTAAKKGCPICNIINSPFSGSKLNPLELHGTTVRAYSVSGDGKSSFDADNLDSDGNNFNHSESGSYSTYLWWNELNLRCTGEKTFTPPLQRKEKPSLDSFFQAYLIAQKEQAKPQPPSQCKRIIQYTGNEVLKTNAENWCNGDANQNDSRSNKPLLIIKKKGKKGEKLPILDLNGREVGCFSYYGTFNELHRWYIGLCSGQTPYALYKSLSNEWGFVPIGDGNCYLINAVRRLGNTR